MSPRAFTALRRVILALTALLAALLLLLWLQPIRVSRVVHQGVPDVTARYLLTDHAGASVGPEAFHGRNVVYLFGWTRDPDVTPAALQVLAAALSRPPANDIVPVFISLDPDRDDPPALKRALARLAPPFTGLTGSAADIAALARAMRLYHRRVDDPEAPGGYRIEHTLLYYVFQPDGQFAGIVPYETSAMDVRKGLDALIK